MNLKRSETIKRNKGMVSKLYELNNIVWAGEIMLENWLKVSFFLFVKKTTNSVARTIQGYRCSVHFAKCCQK